MKTKFEIELDKFIDNHPGAGDHYFCGSDNKISARWGYAHAMQSQEVAGLVTCLRQIVNASDGSDNMAGAHAQDAKEALAKFEGLE